MSSERGFVLSLDIGGAHCKIGLVAPDGKVIEVEFVETEQIRKEGVEKFTELLTPYVKKHSVEAISIAMPATVDWEHNYVRSRCPQVPWLEDAVNKRYIQDELHRPVTFVNDVEALMVGEWRWGELRGMNSGVVISLGETMGSAFLWEGKPQQGRRGSIMELQHVSLETNGEAVENQPPGSSNNWLSGAGLRRQLKKENQDISLEDFFQSDIAACRKIRELFEDKLAHLLGLVVMLLDPERIVLSGGLTASHKYWLPAVKDKMETYVMEQFSGLPTVLLGQLRGEEVIKGPAAFYDWHQEG